MRFPRFVPMFICITLNTFSLFAQSPDGNINGLVSDPSSAAVVGAEVVAVNDVTAVQYTTKSNSEGIYVLPNLPPGPYRVQVSKIGFKTIIKPDIVLNVQDALSINFSLPVGAFHEIITVEGGAPLVNTENATVSTVIDRQFAENLPMNGRSFQTLIYLTPGVVATPSTAFDNGQFSVSGQRPSSNYWMVDGVSANIGISASQLAGNGLGGAAGSFSALGGTNSLVSVDAMQEFRIQTSTFAPEFGRTPGGQISIVTRSGENHFHGTAFDYLRNEVLDAANWFNGYTNSPPLAKAQERQNDFGGTFGGPILKDRTFFFFSYEGLRLRLPQTTLSYVPDLGARQNAVVSMQPYLNAFPLPNGPDDLPTGTAEFKASYSNPATLDAESIRIDHRLNHRWSILARYNYSPSEFVARGGGAALSVVQPSRITTQTLTAGATCVVSPVMTDELRFNYSIVRADGAFSLDNFGGAIPLLSPPLPASYTSQNSNFGLYIFNLGTADSVAVGRTVQNVQRQINIVNTVSWQRGSHALKFGVDFRRLSPFFGPARYSQSPYFSDVLSAEAANADFGGFVGAANNVTLLFHNLGVYAQDTWRVAPRLTVTYGLRWDLDFAPSSVGGPAIPAVTGYNLSDFSQMAVASPGTAPFKTTYGNIAPRIGIAYQVLQSQDRQTVLRGGFGVFYDLVSAETGTLLGQLGPPFGASVNLPGGPFPYTPDQIAPPLIPSAGTLSQFYGFNPALKLPYTLEWNVALEQSLGKNQALSVSYLGAAGRRLLQTTYLFNPPTNPTLFGGLIDNTAWSDYGALQVQFQRRLSNGLQVLASYTWAHSIDNASASSYGNSSNLGVPGNFNGNRGDSDFDIRQGFTVGLTYDLPALSGNRLATAAFHGWSAETFFIARSAPPLDLSDAHFFELNGGVFTTVRPDVAPGQLFYTEGAQCLLVFGVACPGGKGINPAAFQDPPTNPATGNPIRQGNLGRNSLRAFGAAQWDFAVHRDFRIVNTLKLQFRMEAFNLVNHPNFGPPLNRFGVTGFGLASETLGQSLAPSGSQGAGAFNPLYQIGGPRSIQLALKLIF